MRLVMMGTGTFAEPTFTALLRSGHPVVGLVTQPERAIGAQRGSTRQVGEGMKEIALKHGVPVYQPERINTPEGVAQLKLWQADLLVVAAYGQILSPDVLAATPHGGINVHASLLPKYRGAAPVAWAIYHGEAQSGVTIIQMTPRLDAGGMIAQEAVPIGPDETAGELETRLAQIGAGLALTSIAQLIAGTAKPLPQDQSQATKAPKLKKEDGQIDFRRTAPQVCTQIRAMQPWPTAYTFLHREGKEPVRLIVNRTAALPMPDIAGWEPPAGAVVQQSLKDLKLVVWTGGPGQVEILELQPAGKRRMAAAEFLRGLTLREGDRLGPEA